MGAYRGSPLAPGLDRLLMFGLQLVRFLGYGLIFGIVLFLVRCILILLL